MTIRLVTLGSSHSFDGDRPLDLHADKEAYGALIYLAVQRVAESAALADLLWPDLPTTARSRELDAALARLDEALGTGRLQRDGATLCIAEDIIVDAVGFEDHARAGRHAEAIGAYAGDFLAGWSAPSEPFRQWVEARRRSLRHLLHHAASARIASLLATGDHDVAVELAERWVELQPLDDEANHALVQTLVAAGERAEALAHFELYRNRLRTELDVPPLDKTASLVERLHSADPVSAGIGTRRVGLLGELTRRRVLRMAGWYAASLFVVLQSVQALQEALYLPPWLLTATALVGISGFPIALLLSWQFDLTPEGILRTDWSSRGGRRALSRGDWRIVSVAMVMILASTVAAFSTSTVRSLFAGDRAAPLRCPDGSLAPCRRAIPVEANRYVVLPLAHANGVEPQLIDGEICARLLGEGLSFWQDLTAADPLRLNEALQRLTPDIRRRIPVDTGLAIAREVGAGRVIMGELWHFQDTTRVRALLYDAVTGRLLESGQREFASVPGDPGKEFYRLAQDLIVGSGSRSVGRPAAFATTSWAALHAYHNAWNAIAGWDLPAARQHLLAALQRDPAYPYAHLWLAHVMLWQADSPSVWQVHAERAAAAAERLGPRDQLLARGIAALSAGRFALACEQYRELLARDSASFLAWYGLAECLARDRTVHRDSMSPSGWSFASSYEQAIRAHQRALQLVPSFNEAFVSIGSSRLAALLFLSPAKFRSGASRDSLPFAARPELVADTLRLVPYPHAEWSRRAVPAANAALIDRHRAILRHAATTWAGAFPNSPRALEALAAALEQTGELERSATAGNAGLDVIRRARRLESGRASRIRLAAAEVRFLFKVERFREARELAIETLRANRPADADDARRLAGLAGLTGQPHAMAELLAFTANDFDYDVPPGGEAVAVPHDLAVATARLLAYASVGAPLDSIRLLDRRAHAVLARSTPAAERATMHAATLDRAARVLYPVLGPDDVHRSNTSAPAPLRIQRMLVAGDVAGARRALGELAALQSAMRPTDAAADGVLTMAHLHLAIGDSAAAVALIDAYLGDIGNVPSSHFRQAYQPVAIVRLMQLRGELAMSNGDARTARRWSRAVIDLWQNGDREIRPVLRRMRVLARAR